ncbi:MAG: VPLPA-CTERM sorting domain-containing protein [Pirellulales bacterium]|nr:VPLPA-CTERM sorting domain-containing protein [Planctomycetales bacterium]
MKRTRLFALLAAAMVLSIAPSVVRATPVNHGTFMGDDVWYVDVTEDSGTDPGSLPLYGTPTVTGNSIDFSPTGFNAYADDTGQSDTTDGTLSFMLQAKDGFYLATLFLSEAGDTSLGGFSGDAFTSVTASVFIDILEVDGVPISSVNVPPVNMVFTPSNGDYQLSTDGGGGPAYDTTWTGSVVVDLGQALMNGGQPFKYGATKVTVTMDNTLKALSQPGAEAFIAKKDVDGLSITPEILDIPEPASALLLIVGMTTLGVSRRRR